MHSLHPGLRRLLAITVLIAVTLGALALVKAALRVGAQAIDGVQDARFELAQVQRRLQASAQVTPTEIARQAAELGALLTWQGQPEDGDARLQGRVGEILRESGLELLQMRSAAPTRAGPLLRATLDASGSGPEAALYDMLARIEGARPPLRIDRLVIRSIDAMNPPTAAGARVQVEFRVSAFGAAGSGS